VKPTSCHQGLVVGLRRLSLCAAVLLFLVSRTAHGQDALDGDILRLRNASNQNGDYLAGYPVANNDPNVVRRNFLALDSQDNPKPAIIPYPSRITDTINHALALQSQPMSDSQRDSVAAVVSQNLELYIQGLLVSGNIFLLEGLRVNYPNAGGSQARPQSPDMPLGCPEQKYPNVPTKASCVADLFYKEAITGVMDTLSRNAGNSLGLRIRDVTTDDIPPEYAHLPGAFSATQFPQYTYYIDTDRTAAATPKSIVPVLTEGYQMGELLEKQALSTQTIAYRLWSAAYYGVDAQKSRPTQQGLLDEAVRTLHAGANAQFLAGIALAATVRSDPPVQGHTPFDFDHLGNVRTNVAEAGKLISRIRSGDKPMLPIDEVMAGDAQVKSVMSQLLGQGLGSLSAAQQAQTDAEAALFKVQTNALQAFTEAQKRQSDYLDRLRDLTGIDPATLNHDISSLEGQDEYRARVADRITSILGSSDAPASTAANQLDKAAKQLLVARQEVYNKNAIFTGFAERIKIQEDKLGSDVKAIEDARYSISAAQLAMGKANSISITSSAGVSFQPFPAPYVGISVTYNPGAVRAAELQNDITYAQSVQDIRFRNNDTAAVCRNLLIDQAQAYNDLKLQVIIFQNAEDDVRTVLGTADQILVGLRKFNSAAADLYYHDPSFNTQQTAEEQKANLAMDAVVRNLYKLGKLLEMRWLEPFSNPIAVPDGQPIALDAQYDNFWSLESVFALGSVNVKDPSGNVIKPYLAAQNFLGALMQWEGKLGQVRSFDGDLSAVDISLRQDVYGFADFKTVNGQLVPRDPNPSSNPTGYADDQAAIDQNIRKFQNVLLRNGRYMLDVNNIPIMDRFRGFQIAFSIQPDNRGRNGKDKLFGPVLAWNYRIKSFKLKLISVPGKQVSGQPGQQLQFYFAQAGTTSNVDFFERAKGAGGGARRYKNTDLDNYVRYSKDSLGDTSSSSPYLRFAPFGIDSYVADSSIPTTGQMDPQFWSPFTTAWLLEIPPISDFSIESIADIYINVGLKSGQPPSACDLGPCH